MKFRAPSSLLIAVAIATTAASYKSFLTVEARSSRPSSGGRGASVPSSSTSRRGPSSPVSSKRSSSASRSKRRGGEYEDIEARQRKSSRDSRVNHDERDYGEEEDEDDFGFGNIPGDDVQGVNEDSAAEGAYAYDDGLDDNAYGVRGSERPLEEEEDEEEDLLYQDEYDDYAPSSRKRHERPSRVARSRGPPSGPSSSGRGTSTVGGRGSRVSNDLRSDGRRPSRSQGGRHGRGGRGPPGAAADRRGGRVVPYGSAATARRGVPQPGAFARGLSALRESIPDPATIKDTALQSLSAAKETTSKLSSNLYREIKGLTSSELEQVMLKATQPNDLPVKGKHVERLVGVTYQISGRYDIYDAVLRKLWSKMVEKDWRTTIKALYILHRFSADGAPDHQAALKARLRELRRTRDPKRKEKYFNSKQLLAGESTPANIAFRAFLGRYAHYVLLRAQCFGGMFSEIMNDPNAKKSTKTNQPVLGRAITSTCLKNEHLEASQMLLKAGLACALKDGEECENTAIALERVVSDLIGLTTAVATALNRALTSEEYESGDIDKEVVKKWCNFYSEELLPKTKGMVKSSSPTLDAYGLFLPSRMGATVSPDLLQKGLKAAGSDIVAEKSETVTTNNESQDEEEVCREGVEDNDAAGETSKEQAQDGYGDEDENVYDEYEYDEYEYDEY